jgi:hypothetical protein
MRILQCINRAWKEQKIGTKGQSTCVRLWVRFPVQKEKRKEKNNKIFWLKTELMRPKMKVNAKPALLL